MNAISAYDIFSRGCICRGHTDKFPRDISKYRAETGRRFIATAAAAAAAAVSPFIPPSAGLAAALQREINAA